IDILEAETRQWREDRAGWRAHGMRLWKRSPLQQIFGRYTRIRFAGGHPARPHMVWAGKADTAPAGAVRVEDGFLRSRGLGAQLVPPLSLVLDKQGIYYDPEHPSDLEEWITRRAHMRPDQTRRAEALQASIAQLGVTKYNLGGAIPALPEGRRILVPGQVEDDASIRTGAGSICTNLALLQTVRDANPDAIIIYK